MTTTLSERSPWPADSSNPLLEDALHCRYQELTAEHSVPAITALLGAAQECLGSVVQDDAAPDWDRLVAPLDRALGRLSRAWAIVGHLHAVRDTPAWREAYTQLLPEVTRFYTGLEQHEGLYARLLALQASHQHQEHQEHQEHEEHEEHEEHKEHEENQEHQEHRRRHEQHPRHPGAAASGSAMPHGDPAQLPDRAQQRRRAIALALRDFRLTGVELDPQRKASLATLLEELSSLSQKFSENILDAMDAGELLVTDAAQLKGLPADVIEAARRSAQERNREGWRFTAHMPSYLPVVQYAEDRPLRRQMVRLYTTLASDQGDARFDNAPIMESILAKRQACAELLGFAQFSDYALEPKMAESGEQVLQFLTDLAARARPQAQRDIASLARFAAEELGIPDLEAWDIAFTSQQLKKKRFSFTDQDLKPYFPLDQVLDGLFALIDTLFGFRFTPLSVPTWHPEVRSFALYRLRCQAGDPGVAQYPQTVSGPAQYSQAEPWAYVHLDLFARPGKRNGAWMSAAADRRREDGQLKPAVTWLNANFQPPVGDRPALLTHADVTTLLHEFGHGLHHMLTAMEEPRICGLNGVEWDAVELPSQFLENFAWEWETLSRMSRHIDTGESLPRALFERMTASRNFLIGMHLVRQLEFALFDLQLHRRTQAADHTQINALLRAIRADIAVVPYPDFNRFANSFSHIFAGGYASGYYSYLWAEVLSADCYAAFVDEREGTLCAREESARRTLGRDFLRTILAVGSARPTLESFRAFRGRDPSIDALLRFFGMESPEPSASPALGHQGPAL